MLKIIIHDQWLLARYLPKEGSSNPNINISEIKEATIFH